MSTPSKYAENQFDAATQDRFPLMTEVLADAVPRAAAAAAADPAFTAASTALAAAQVAWEAGEVAILNASATAQSGTVAFSDKMDSLTRPPDADTPSPLERWDVGIRGQVRYQGVTYTLLLPQGRETVTLGSYDMRLDALAAFGSRLRGQTSHPALVTIGNEVGVFATAARMLRDAQGADDAALRNVREAQEPLRVAAAVALFKMVGVGIVQWAGTPERVDTLFDVNLLRSPGRGIPEAPADTFWIPSERRLRTSVLPLEATHLVAWRIGPGGAAEQVGVGEKGALEVTIPADITFDAGKVYTLWLTARNGEGNSVPGPLQTWTAT